MAFHDFGIVERAEKHQNKQPSTRIIFVASLKGKQLSDIDHKINDI